MKKILLLLAVLFWISACTDILDIDPVSMNSGDLFWEEGEVAVEKALAGVYANLRDPFADGRWIIYGDLASEFTVRWNSWSWWVYFPVTEIDTENDRTYNHERLDKYRNWSVYYKAVSSANILIKHTEAMPVEEFGKNLTEATKQKNKYLGEAYFLRAFTYFYMVRIWGDVPIYKEGIESSSDLVNDNGETKDLAASSEIDVLHFIQEDLAKAISYLEYDNPGSQTWAIHANKASAQTLKAHVNTWLANRDDANKTTLLNEAIQCIDSVETQGGYTLINYDDADAMRNMFKGGSTESIFEIYISAADNESFRCESGDFDLLTLLPDLTNYRSVFQIYNEDRNALYNMDDKRQAFFFNWERGKPRSENNNPGNEPGEWTGTTVHKYGFFTHDDKEDPLVEDAYFVNASIPIFRLSGLKLLKAEVFAKVNRFGEARTALNESLNRCGIADFLGSDDELIVEIIRERARELVGEGHSYFDRIRNNYFDGMTSMDDARIAGKGYYWPIAYKLTLTNKALIQQPYWKGKVPEITE
ncbi:MAG: RagB/SusD family nutrient uptake outer membrane protein [Bacteroidales bacterium]|nr:RagB/SusD family nutrient uptake outer membrane protein [Bacteroidales bacterium]